MYRMTTQYEKARFQDMLHHVEQERQHLLYLDDAEILREKDRSVGRQTVRWLKLALTALIRLIAG